MEWIARMRRRLRVLLRKEDVERDLETEMRFHLEMEAEDLAHLRGLDTAEARRRAAIAFGGVERFKEDVRDVRGTRLVEDALADARFAARTLARNPGFAVAAIVTLALGIGATTAIFSVVNGILLRPLPYPRADRIVQLLHIGEEGNRMPAMSDPNVVDLAEGSRSFRAIATTGYRYTVPVSGAREPVRASVVPVSRDFLAVMGVQPARGRAFLPDEHREGGSPAVLVSHGFWQRQLDGATEAIGRSLTFNDRVHTIVGIMPADFDYPTAADLWIPRELTATSPSRTAHNARPLARLADGVSIDQARAEVSAIAKRLRAQHGDDTWMVDADVAELREGLVGSVRPALLVLLGASAVLLLIACANVTNLLLARASTRQRELAVRRALGAGRGRLVRQFLAEALILALAGGALGVLLALWGVRALVALQPANLPRLAEIRVDWVVLAFAFALAVGTAVALGLLAALRGATDDLRPALAEGGRTLAGGTHHRVRSALVVGQMAMTLVLLVGAGLLGRSFLRLISIEPGYRTAGAVVLDVVMPWPEDEASARRLVAQYDALSERLRALPGVAAVGGVNDLPLAGGNYANGAFGIMTSLDERLEMADFERMAKDPARSGYAAFRIAGPDYFRAMDIPLVRGRTFDMRDDFDAPHVAVISESLAKAEWPNEDPIGKIIQYGNMDGVLTPFTIVGIVGDVREANLASDPEPTFYGSYRQRPGSASRFSFVMQGEGDPATVTAAARSAVRSILPDAPPRFRTIEEIVARSLADRRFSLVLLGVFGAAALLLAVTGVYSVISYLVTQREREIGIRIALGARSSTVLALVVRHGAVLAGAGILVGLLAALGLTRLLRGLLFGVSATDPVAFAAVAASLALVAVVASWIPARRAARVEPMRILRGE
jgi:predicted permease